MINKLVFLFVFSMILAGCQSRRTIVSLTSPDMQISGAGLRIGDRFIEIPGDSTNTVRFELDDVPTLCFSSGIARK